MLKFSWNSKTKSSQIFNLREKLSLLLKEYILILFKYFMIFGAVFGDLSSNFNCNLIFFWLFFEKNARNQRKTCMLCKHQLPLQVRAFLQNTLISLNISHEHPFSKFKIITHPLQLYGSCDWMKIFCNDSAVIQATFWFQIWIFSTRTAKLFKICF